VSRAGDVDAYGTVQYFNASKTLVRQGDSIELTCGATLQKTDEFHSLVVHMRKWFNGSRPWLMSVNEDLEFFGDRYSVEANEFGEVDEFKFSILSKNCRFCVRKFSGTD